MITRAKILVPMLIFALEAGTNGCSDASTADRTATKNIGNTLSENQPTPTDIEYSLERFNLIRRAYEVNGEHGRAMEVEYPGPRPTGYVVLMTGNGMIVGYFEVDGKVSSLNSFLTPDSEKYATSGYAEWLPDVDGSYGENDTGIFFFTPEGHYHEWNSLYFYSETPLKFDGSPIITYDE